MNKHEIIKMIPVEKVHIINPRSREGKRYKSITTSIHNLGLKMPIVVSVRKSTAEEADVEYDLVCGQGRLETFIAAKEHEIPARVIDVPKDDLLLMSLIENIARRKVRRAELTSEILRLVEEGYSTNQIAEKIDSGPDFVRGVIHLHKQGELRLLQAVMNEKMSYTIALEIARSTDDTEAQSAIVEAYEDKKISSRDLPLIRRIVERRQLKGKGYKIRDPRKFKTNKETLVATYQREVDKQKKMTKKSHLCETRLVFIKEAFTRLLADDNFQTLLRAEKMESIPEPLSHLLALEK